MVTLVASIAVTLFVLSAILFVVRYALFPWRVVSVKNLDNFCYHILMYEGSVEVGSFRLPCQHLPWLLYHLPRFNKRHPVELTFEAYDLSSSHTVSIPPWARRSLLRQLKKLRETWSPKWTEPAPEGIFR